MLPASVPAGAPVVIEYRWVVGSAAVPFAGRYRAFVHLLDDEGALLATDDHEPVPPPNAWKPGSTYSYRRLVLTPAFPFAGVATIAVGLYDMASGDRLALAGDAIGRRRFRVATLRLLPRDRDLPLRCVGFYAPEASVAAPLLVGRFMRDEVRCVFLNPAEDVLLFVRGDIEPQGFAAPPRLTIASTARRARSVSAVDLPLTSEVQTFGVRVPGRDLGRGADGELVLRMSATYRPQALGVVDPRELSLRVFGLYVTRAARADDALLAAIQPPAQ